MFYVSFRITTKQKPTVDTQRVKRRESRHTTVERHEFKAGKKDKKKGTREPQKVRKTAGRH